MQDQFKPKKWIIFVVLFVVLAVIATPVLADYLGPNRVVTTTGTSCSVVLYECSYVAAKDEYRYRRAEDWSCSNESKPWQAYPSDGEGCSDDTVGDQFWKHVESEQEITTTYPSATITGSLQNCTLQNGWCGVTTPEVFLSANEPVAGYNILLIEGTRNGEVFACPSGAASCSVPVLQGSNSFAYWAISSWGDSSEMGISNINVDTVSPDLSLDIRGSSGANGWYVSPTTITAVGSDATSGLLSVQLSVDSGAWQPSVTLNDGVYEIDVAASDIAGNTSGASTTISVDTTTPSINVALKGTTGNNGWYRSIIEISALASDATSGVGTFEVSADRGGYQGYTSPIFFSDGHHTIQFKAIDQAGNITEIPLQEFYVDTTPPAIRLPSSWQLGKNVDYDVQDDGSGLASLRLVIEDEDERYAKVAWNESVSGNTHSEDINWDGQFKDKTIAPPGTYLVWLKAADKAGNEYVKLGKVIVPEPNYFSNLSPTEETTGPTPAPPQDLYDADAVVPEINSPAPDTSPSLSANFGGSTTESTHVTTQSQFLTSGTSATIPSTSSNVLWGAAAAAVIASATAYALTEGRKREEAARETAEKERKSEGRRARIKVQKMKKLEAKWAQEKVWEEARKEEEQKQQAVANARMDAKMDGVDAEDDARWQASQAVIQQREDEKKKVELQGGLAAYYSAMRQGEKEASNTPPTWWDNTKSFVHDKIIQPVNTYVYEPYIVPAIDKRNEVLESVVSWANEKIYEPHIQPAWNKTKQFVSNEIAWMDENINQPYIQPALEKNKQFLKNEFAWIDENIYEPYLSQPVERTKEFVKSEFAWINENIYQPTVEKTKQYTAWLDETIYEPFLQPVVSTIDEKIYQPVFAPVVNDINQYVYQPIVNKAEDIWDKYGEWVHGALDTVGFIPGLGEIADGLNGVIYLGEGRYVEAGVSLLAMVPLVGDLGKAGKWTVEIGQEVVEEVVEKVAKEGAEELLEKAVKETVEEVSEKIVKEVGEELAEKIGKETLEEVAAKTAKEFGEELIETTTREAVEKTTKEASSEVIRKTVSDTVSGASVAPVKEVSEFVEKNLEGETLEVVAKYGDEAAKLVNLHGPDAAQIIFNYGDDGVAVLQKHGKEAINLIKARGGLAIRVMDAVDLEAAEKLLATVSDDDLYSVIKQGSEVVAALSAWDEVDLLKHGAELAARAKKDSQVLAKVKELVDLRPIDPKKLTPKQEELIEFITENSTFYVDEKQIVLGKWANFKGGFLEYARKTDSMHYGPHPKMYDLLGGLENQDQVAWLVNQRVIQRGINSGKPFEYSLNGIATQRIDYEKEAIDALFAGAKDEEIMRHLRSDYLPVRMKELQELQKTGHNFVFDEPNNSYILARP
jgi:hypothetical protein